MTNNKEDEEEEDVFGGFFFSPDDVVGRGKRKKKRRGGFAARAKINKNDLSIGIPFASSSPSPPRRPSHGMFLRLGSVIDVASSPPPFHPSFSFNIPPPYSSTKGRESSGG
jgi:hypothetical protein